MQNVENLPSTSEYMRRLLTAIPQLDSSKRWSAAMSLSRRHSIWMSRKSRILVNMILEGLFVFENADELQTLSSLPG